MSTKEETSIVIVDDEPEILNILQSIFSNYFKNIYTANNGKSGLDLIVEKKPDIVLTDIRMPELSGVDMVVKMRSAGINTPVVMISSSKDREHLLKAIKLGVHDFVDKPFKRADVENAVHRVLEMTVRNNDLPKIMFLYGKDSKEVKQQQKFVGLLQAMSVQNDS